MRHTLKNQTNFASSPLHQLNTCSLPSHEIHATVFFALRLHWSNMIHGIMPLSQTCSTTLQKKRSQIPPNGKRAGKSIIDSKTPNPIRRGRLCGMEISPTLGWNPGKVTDFPCDPVLFTTHLGVKSVVFSVAIIWARYVPSLDINQPNWIPSKTEVKAQGGHCKAFLLFRHIVPRVPASYLPALGGGLGRHERNFKRSECLVGWRLDVIII